MSEPGCQETDEWPWARELTDKISNNLTRGKVPAMDILPDQLLFVNKTPSSNLLSRSDPEEKFYIQSYVHSRNRKQAAKQPKSCTRTDSSASSQSGLSEPPTVSLDLNAIRKLDTTTNPSAEKQTQGHEGSQSSTASPLQLWFPRVHFEGNSVDPFRCTSVIIDDWTYELLQYPFSSYIETTFKAESLSLSSNFSPNAQFRHRRAITERLQRCIADELQMYATLAYCSSYVKSYIGKTPANRRPTEFYVLQTIKALRARLSAQQQAPVDS